MRRFNHPARFFTSPSNITAKREMGVPSGRDFAIAFGFLFTVGSMCIAALVMGAYKLGRYIEKSSHSSPKMLNDAPRLVYSGPVDLGSIDYSKAPNSELQRMFEKVDLTGFRIDSAGYWSRAGGLEKVEQENSPKP